MGSLTVLGTVHPPRTEAGRKGVVVVKAAHSAAPPGEKDLSSGLSWRADRTLGPGHRGAGREFPVGGGV